MNIKKYAKDIIVSIFIFSLVWWSYAVWTWLIAEAWDTLLIDKWNELVNKVLVLETDSTTNSNNITTLQNESASILQTHIFSDYTRSTTVDWGFYYFWWTEFSNTITPEKVDSIIQININYFWESTHYNNHTRLQYSINSWTWTDFDLVSVWQQWTLNVWFYPDTDYNSTPHSSSTQVAKAFSTTGTISFRMYHFNTWTFYHNSSVNSLYESGWSTLVLKELNADNSTYTKR